MYYRNFYILVKFIFLMLLKKFSSSSKRLGLIALFSIFMLNCEENIVNEPVGKTNEDLEEQIENLYYDWAMKSRLRDYQGMLAISVPRSSVEGMTNVCKSSWDEGAELYYVYNSVKVYDLQETPPKAKIYGNWEMHQGRNTEVYSGGFNSSSWPTDGEFYGDNWKLDGISFGLEENWWE